MQQSVSRAQPRIRWSSRLGQLYGGLLSALLFAGTVQAQPVPEDKKEALSQKLAALMSAVEELKLKDVDSYLLADVAVYAKAAEWCARHEEFYTPAYADQALAGLERGLERAALLAKEETPWDQQAGSLIRGYVSTVDGSYQPYAVKLPPDFVGKELERWPLHVHLHGRGDKLNEVNFIQQHDGKSVPADQTWIQLDVFGRTNNAYRWAGETDVFEAITAVRRRYRIDGRKIVLRGFSMGGAGAWHLGLQHPSQWCSVGPGAGFVDFYKYQKVDQKLPPYQDATLKIYDAIDYVMNAADVPVCTYGGEIDPQLAASTEMVEAAKELDVPIKLIIGPQTGHKFHPESFKEYMAFHLEHQAEGRRIFPGLQKIRFITYTLKYNTCEWITIEDQLRPYEAMTVEGHIDHDKNEVYLKTKNVGVIRVARDAGNDLFLDGIKFNLTTAADALLPYVYFQSSGEGWDMLNYDSSLGFNKNLDFRKRHDLQGPIDDAFMSPFVCVKPTGEPWSAPLNDYANWSLSRFSQEFDKWMRAQVPAINDSEVTPELMQQKHLILFGDPGSNKILANLVKKLPIKWTKDELEVAGRKYSTQDHAVVLIYPNPINARKYIVINTGHSFHTPQFLASNAQLYPRLGDIAVLKFEQTDKGYQETTEWAEIFNSSWRLPKESAPQE